MVSWRADTALTAYGWLLIACPWSAVLPASKVARRTDATFTAYGWPLIACPWLAVLSASKIAWGASASLAGDGRIGTIGPDSKVVMLAPLLCILIRLGGKREHAEDKCKQNFHSTSFPLRTP